MKKRWRRVFPGLMMLLLSGCAGPTQVATIPAGQDTAEVTARNFDFSPALIRTRAGRSLNLRVKSASGTEHNITVKSPAGEILVSQDLPPGKTVTVAVPLREPGEYPFYCDRTMHSTLGMKGRLVAE